MEGSGTKPVWLYVEEIGVVSGVVCGVVAGAVPLGGIVGAVVLADGIG